MYQISGKSDDLYYHRLRLMGVPESLLKSYVTLEEEQVSSMSKYICRKTHLAIIGVNHLTLAVKAAKLILAHDLTKTVKFCHSNAFLKMNPLDYIMPDYMIIANITGSDNEMYKRMMSEKVENLLLQHGTKILISARSTSDIMTALCYSWDLIDAEFEVMKAGD
jgi:hypothetical protein